MIELLENVFGHLSHIIYDMKILITGSSGFVGKHLRKRLSGKHQIIKYDLKDGQDILDQNLLSKKMKRVDLVIHLAAFISAEESWRKPKEYFVNNSLGTLSVVRNSIKAGVKKMIYFSSAAVKAKPLTPYAASKISAEAIVKLYSNKIHSVIVRPENIYGIGQKANYGYVIHSFIKAARLGKSLEIFGSGMQSRDFIYIDDVTKVVETLITSNVKSGSVISLGTGKQAKILDLAKLVMKVTNKKTNINFKEKRIEPLKSVADVKMLKLLGIDPKKFTQLNDGIKRLIETEYSR